ncbi:hypothetical protein C8J57DRAFT_1506014 [Mycena rebaudengoi]|nr:hypothetical protein C8J57DRAFT_1506014 [Mycena rebaudengoi]
MNTPTSQSPPLLPTDAPTHPFTHTCTLTHMPAPACTHTLSLSPLSLCSAPPVPPFAKPPPSHPDFCTCGYLCRPTPAWSPPPQANTGSGTSPGVQSHLCVVYAHTPAPTDHTHRCTLCHQPPCPPISPIPHPLSKHVQVGLHLQTLARPHTVSALLPIDAPAHTPSHTCSHTPMHTHTRRPAYATVANLPVHLHPCPNVRAHVTPVQHTRSPPCPSSITNPQATTRR